MKLSEARSKSSSPETHNQSNRGPFRPKIDDFESQSMYEKLKASNFPALFLKIGSWEVKRIDFFFPGEIPRYKIALI
jgi:hypothetical protein